MADVALHIVDISVFVFASVDDQGRGYKARTIGDIERVTANHVTDMFTASGNDLSRHIV
ncbi:hypothetical protein [Pseudomonas sp. PP3]|uniref:hypothetical protein n=1 Tax=Pseudomonas sp. PP3 TaxID=2815936 RepID=UPI001BAF3640|nr:hypothetical protein [Pseudomonas sp. PP3]